MTKHLSELRVGEKGTVTNFLCQDTCMLRVQEMGLCMGTEVEVVQIAPFGDPVELQFRGCRFCMRKHELSSIEVEVDDSKMA